MVNVPNDPHGPSPASDLSALSQLAPQLAQTFVSIASDIALVIDDAGVIQNVALGAEPLAEGAQAWVGRAWADTVTGETRRKVELLLTEARAGRVTQRREVNHATDGGHDIPVAYAAVRLGANGPVLAVGRDLRAVSAIQQRFVEAQQAMERDYWRRRQAEARYRMLFQVATDGVLVIDAERHTVLEANRAAAELFHRVSPDWGQQALLAGISSVSRAAVEALFLTARTTGRPGEIRAWLAGDGRSSAPQAADLSATPFSVDGVQQLLVRVRSVDASDEPGAASMRLANFVDRTPDAVAITDAQGRVLMANAAFDALCRDLSGGSAPALAVGHALLSLLGDGQGRLPDVLALAHRQGIVAQRPCVLSVADAPAIEVEVSVAVLAEGDQECLGMTLRRVDQRQASLPVPVRELAPAIGHLASQVGLVSLPELLRETSDLAERHLLEVAVNRSPGDLNQAAALLGIQPNELWVRLRHHGLADDHPQPPGRLN